MNTLVLRVFVARNHRALDKNYDKVSNFSMLSVNQSEFSLRARKLPFIRYSWVFLHQLTNEPSGSPMGPAYQSLFSFSSSIIVFLAVLLQLFKDFI